MIGLDTGFFVELLRNNQKAVKIWGGITEGDESSVSCLTLYELKKLSLKKMIAMNAVNILLEAIMAICKVVRLDKVEVLNEAAHISQSYGIHAIDSLILASFAFLNVRTIYTTDAHFEKYEKKGTTVIHLTRNPAEKNNE